MHQGHKTRPALFKGRDGPWPVSQAVGHQKIDGRFGPIQRIFQLILPATQPLALSCLTREALSGLHHIGG